VPTRAPLAIVLLLLVGAPARPSAQSAWVAEWLREYAAGGQSREGVMSRLETIGDLSRLQRDLEAVLESWLKEGESPDAQRRAIAAFAMDAAFTQLGVGKPAVDLTEWGCRQIRRLRNPGEFERRWHLAGFALFSGVVDPDAIDAHASHMRLQFRSEPRLTYERAVAHELRAAPFYESGKASVRDVRKHNEEAAKLYREALKLEAVREEATLRLAHVELQLGRAEQAIAVLEGYDPEGDDDLRYLAHLFRGQAYERLTRNDEARREYGLALGIRPRTQSGSVALAALFFRDGQRNLAEQIVREVLERTEAPTDPWWTYWPADYRQAATLVAAMREALR
jgi:tetratricopeptide (TPR) repeat protein